MKTKITRSRISIPGFPSKVMQNFSTTTILKRFGVPTAIVGAALALVLHGQVSVQAQPAPSLEPSPSQAAATPDEDEDEAIPDDQDLPLEEPLEALPGEALPAEFPQVDEVPGAQKPNDVNGVSSASSKPDPAVNPAGKDTDGTPLYVCYGNYKKVTYPGKLKNNTCTTGLARKERKIAPYTKFSYLPGYSLSWVEKKQGAPTPGGVLQFEKSGGRYQHFCRFKRNDGSIQPGRATSLKGSMGFCIAGVKGGAKKAPGKYEVLVAKRK
jgi:hypothetical protein